MERVATERSKTSRQLLPLLIADVCNKICRERTLAIKAAEPIGLAVDGGILAMNWKEQIEAISAHATFSAPAEEQALFAAETQLGLQLPQSLRELLAESNGVRGEYDLALIWPVERIVADNRSFRESVSFRTLYMPFEGLLFFADAGNGDQFAFAVAGGQVRRSDIFVWNHEDDSRTWLAKDLREYLEGWISGRIAI